MGKKRSTRRSKKGKRSGGGGGLKVLHPNAGGIDIGSTSHYAAVPASVEGEGVREFGCLTPDLHEMAQWFVACAVDTVALESTGVYWIPVAEVLEAHGLEVVLVDARQVRNVSSRKTDVQDCQWIQELHSYGLLPSAFRPAKKMEILRSYWRQRDTHVRARSQQIQRMQKAFEQMNIQLHKVLSDLAGVTGMKIVRAILRGERDPEGLVAYCHALCKRPREDFLAALTGQYREDHLFALQQAVELFDIYEEKLHKLDSKIQAYMRRLKGPVADPESKTPARRKPSRPPRRKNQPHFDLRSELIRLCGVDLTQIDGIDALTAQTLITEQGIDMSAFPNEKHFASHLGLCPNNQITGGKIRKRKTRRVQSRAAKALRLAAQSLHKNDSALGAFYRRINGRHGPAKAITATAHKLAKIIYRMLKHGEEYVRKGQEQYEAHFQKQKLKSLIKQAKRIGCGIVITNTGELLS